MGRRASLSVIAVGIALLAAVDDSAAVRTSGGEGVWIRGEVHGLVTAPPSATTRRPVPLYVIAPVRLRHPLHPLADARAEGYGAHDHVAARVFSGPCDLTLLVPGTHGKGKVRTRRVETPLGRKPLVYAARLGGRMLPLTFVGRIRWAERARIVTGIDLTVISCTVAP